MNIKRITLLAVAGIMAATGVFLTKGSDKEHYFPRSNESENTQARSQKGYLEYMNSIRNNRQTGTVSYNEVQTALKQASKLGNADKALNINWRFKGPDNVGGRTRALMIDRNNTNLIYAGSVSGGLWKSTDGGLAWLPYDKDFAVTNISCIAQGPDGVIYVGTGAGFDGDRNNKVKGSNFVGSGLYKLVPNPSVPDDGDFELLVGPTTDLVYGFEWSTINRVAVDPNNAQRIFVAMNDGLRESNDGGQTWTSPLGSDPLGNNQQPEGQDIKITSDGKIVVSISHDTPFAALTNASIFVSTDNGLTYQETNFDGARRIELAIAPSNTSVIYASMANVSGCLYGVYKSRDFGANWTKLSNTPDYFVSLGCQGYYDNAIAVLPNDENKIVAAGVSMFQWTQSSVDPAPIQGEWKSIALTNEFNLNGSRNDFYVHADKHAFVFHPTDPNKLYIGSDGGVGYSSNFLSEFPLYGQNNYGYNVTQFYDIGVGPQDYVIAGAQDNGTQLVGMSFNTGKSGIEVRGGDGFDSELFTINPTLGIASLYFGSLRRVQGIGSDLLSSTFNNANISSGKLAALCGASDECASPFYTAFAKWESFNSVDTKDSVLVALDITEAPPLKRGTVIPFESKNGRIPLTDSLRTDIEPIDTVSSDANFVDTLKVGFGGDGKVTFITAFDTISVDTSTREITFNYREQAPETRTFQFGVREDYTNVFHSKGTLSVTVTETEVIFVDPNIVFKYTVEFPDIVQSYVALLNVRGNLDVDDRNIWLSKDIQKGGNVDEPKWVKIADTRIGNPNPAPTSNFGAGNSICATFSNDGNSLFYGTAGGALYRVDNINDIDISTLGTLTSDEFVVDSVTNNYFLRSFGSRAITSIAVDPNNSNNVIVTLGNYGQAEYVVRSTNALSVSPKPTFVDITGSGTTKLPDAPVYEAIIDYKDSNKVLIATEIGVFGTENAFDADVIWTEENQTLGRVPVHSITQMTFGPEEGAVNQGKVYIGTHARGVFETDNLVGISENNSTDSKEKLRNELKVYPNPMIDNLNIELKLYNRSSVIIEVYSITGQKVRVENLDNPNIGKNTLQLNLSNLDNGTYIIRTIQNGQVSTSKFVKQ